MFAGVNGVMVAQMVTWALSTFAPSGYLAKALANWKSAAQRELERRGQWHPEKLPPQSMLRHAQVW
jgi:hypothetical protein